MRWNAYALDDETLDVAGRFYSLHLEEGESWYPFNASVCPSVTTERLSKLRKITGKKQALFPLGPL